MKLVKVLVFFISILLLFQVNAFAEESSIQVEINGKIRTYDVPPQQIGETVLIPLRQTCSILNAKEVKWDSKTNTVTVITSKTPDFQFKEGSAEAKVGDSVVAMSAPAISVSGRMLVPVDFICDIFGAQWEWNENADTICIYQIPKDVVSALKKFISIYDEDLNAFLVSLYDQGTGGFYFSASGRDNLQFLPDLESTGQMLNYIAGSFERPQGVMLADMMSDNLKQKIIDFIQSKQDPDDGYFYMPQWGKGVNDNRRGRDLNFALAAISYFNVQPLYPTVLDRLKENTDNAETKSDKLNLPDFLLSKEKMISWLESLPWQTNAWSAGGSVNSVVAQINAAGLIDECAEWLTATQNADTGFWGQGINYNTVSGAMKVGSVYTTAGIPFPKLYKALESTVKVVMSNEPPDQVMYVYNPWNLLQSIRDSWGKELPAEWLDQLYQNAPAMLEKSAEKVMLFHYTDGGFRTTSVAGAADSGVSQGYPVGLQVVESNVNSSTIALGSTLSSICRALGIKTVPVYSYSQLAEFIKQMENAKPIATTDMKLYKEGYTPQTKFDFEKYNTGEKLPENITLSSATLGTKIQVSDDPVPIFRNKALLYNIKSSTENPNLKFSTFFPSKYEKVICSFDMFASGFSGDGAAVMVSVGSPKPAVQYVLGASSETVRFGIRRYNSGVEFGTPEYFGKAETDMWVNVRIVYYAGGEHVGRTELYVDEELIYSADDKYFLSDGYIGNAALTNPSGFEFRCFQNKTGLLYLDNVELVAK